MVEIEGKARVSDIRNLASGDPLFDASQYDFFGEVVQEEVELGGLETDGDDTVLVEFDDKDKQFLSHRKGKEGESIGLLSDTDDFSSTFSKLNRTVSDPWVAGFVRGRGSFPRGSSIADLARDPDFSNWIDQHILDAENAHNTKQWSSQPYPFPPQSRPLQRTSSYNEQPHPHQLQDISISNGYIGIPKSSFPSYPLPAGLPISFSSPDLSHYSPSHFASGRLYGPHFGHPGFSLNTHQSSPNYWPNQAAPLRGLHQSNGFMNHRMHQMQPSPHHFSNFQPQLYNSYHSPMLQMAEVREPRVRSQYRSKYMSAEELDNILRIQLAATQPNEPYIDDYYHQACISKKSPRHHFCPASIRDLPSRTKANSEPHAYLQVDALGRIPFSSFRRPRPLLEVDACANTSDEILNQKSSIKSLEQEPMLSARITVEDGISLLIDIDDIDRFLQFSQPQDGGVQLQRRRQTLLGDLAASLQLVDPLGPGVAQNEDLVFLRVISLPKGRKLLSRYIKLLNPRDDSTQVVSMAVFRHLRFLFGRMPSDSTAAKTTTDLVIAVSSVVCRMDLVVLGLCLAAVVCSSEQPPLRPIGSVAGDGATVVVKSVLERATELLTDRNAAANYSARNRDLWQESFNAFFELLIKYCTRKYESIIESLDVAAPNAAPVIGPELAHAITGKIPVELLRVSLPHTNESQKKLLRHFSQRSMPSVTS